MPVDPTPGAAFPGQHGSFRRLHGPDRPTWPLHNGYLPAPTVANQPEGVTNFIRATPWPLTQNQQTYRGDQNLGKLGSVFGRYTHSNYTNAANTIPPRRSSGSSSISKQGKSWEVSHTINIGQKNVNNFRFGYLSAHAPEGSAAPPASAISALGRNRRLHHLRALQQTWPNVSLTL